MRGETNRPKLEQFMVALGRRVGGNGTVFLTDGATAVLYDWRMSTIDVDLSADPEPSGFFEAIAVIKEELDINVELASPADCIPAIPGWRDRSILIARHGAATFRHYDPIGQALSKLQRGHDGDMADVQSMVKAGLVDANSLRAALATIEPTLIRYPAIDSPTFRTSVETFCAQLERRSQ